MSDLMKKENRGKITLGVAGIAGGAGILALMGLVAHHFFPALIVGGLILWGGWRLFQKPKSSLAGMVGMAAGILTITAGIPLVGGLASFLLGVSGVGTLAAGAWTIYKVFRNRRS